MANFVTPDKTYSQRFEPGGLYVGTITRVDDSINRVWVQIPRFVNNFEFGPLAVFGPELPIVGDRVACLFVENRADQIAVLGVLKGQATLPTSFVVTATSTTRPTDRRVGTVLFEEDTKLTFVWDGDSWEPITTSIAGTANEILVNGGTAAARGDVTLSLPATIYADLNGTAASATVALGVADNSVVLGDDTTGNYVATVTAGTGVSFSSGSGTGEGSAPTIAIGQSVASSDSPTFVDLTLSGGDLITNTAASTATVFNTNATTLNIGGAATTVNIGASTGSTSINNELRLMGAISFEGSTNDSFETALTVVDPTADRTITLPNVTGTVVTTGDSGTVTSAMIANGTIVQGDLSSSSVIAWGHLGTYTSTTSTNASAATYVDTDLSLTVNVTAGRRIKWSWVGHAYNSVAGAATAIALRSGSTVLMRQDVVNPVAGYACSVSGFYVETVGAGVTSLTRKISVSNAIPTGLSYFFASSDRVAYLICEDIGMP